MIYPLLKLPFILKVFLFSTLYFGLFFLTTTVRFHVNDDVAMMLTANGYFNQGQPSEYLIFISLWIGLLLKSLYLNFPSLPWYSYFLFSLHFLSFFFFSLTTFYYLKKNQFLAFLQSSLFIFFQFSFMESITFTTTAFTTMITGLFCLQVLSLNREKRFLFYLPPIFLVLLAWMLRSAVLKGTLPFFLILLALKRKNIDWKPLLQSLAVAMTLIITFNFLQKQRVENSPEWSQFLEYNQVRGHIHGFRSSELTTNLKEKVFPEIGWLPLDFVMFERWFFIDQSTYSIEKLKKVQKNLSHNISLSSGFNRAKTNFKGYRYYLIILFLFFVVLVFSNLGHLIKAKTASLFLCLLFLSFYLIFFIRFPARVAIPLFFQTALTATLLLDSKGVRNFLNKKFYLLLTLLFSISTSYCLYHSTVRNSRKQGFKNYLLELTNDIHQIDKKGLFINWGGSIPFQIIDPFVTIEQLPKVDFLGLGWRTHSPLFNDLLQKHNINDLTEALYKNDHIYLIADESRINDLKKYYSTKYNIKLKEELLYKARMFWTRIYKIKKIDNKLSHKEIGS